MTKPRAGAPTPASWGPAAESAAETAGGALVGVLALQGDFLEHLLAFRRLGVAVAEVRLPRDLEGLGALVIPGGESTTMARMMDLHGLREPLKAMARQGAPVWGTCAGMVLMAGQLMEGRPEPLGLMDVRVARNAYGRQVDSFEAALPVQALGPEPFHGVFIRAPRVVGVGRGVEVLASMADGTPVAVRQGSMVACSFHPELTRDLRFHAYFLSLAPAATEARTATEARR